MSTETIHPARTLEGSLVLPGDKSISHRYAMLAGFASGTTRLSNFSTGADPQSSLACMEAMGAGIVRTATHLEITGTGSVLKAPTAALDCGNSGSTMRMLSGLLAAQSGHFTLFGDQSLTQRPMERIRQPLAAMGADISLTGGHAPVEIAGCALRGVDFDTPIASAQVKTAILFAGMQARGTTTLAEAVTTRDHTKHALRAFGATLTTTNRRLSISGDQFLQGSQGLHGIDATVPGDLSSAAFFLCAALLFPGSNLILDALGLNPTRSVLLDVVTALGAKVRLLNVEEQHGELLGTLQVNAAKPHSSGVFEIAGALTAQLIDELPVLAAIAPYTAGGMIIRDAEELRVKESDRINLIARNLKAMGATFTERPDGLEIPGNQQLHGATIDSGGDHRIAMAFAVAALRAQGDTLIQGAEHAAISFPEFFTHLRTLCPQ